MTQHVPQTRLRTRGQALSEMLLVLLALLPLWWLIPMLDKYQQLSHATLLASRYAAWDDTWFPSIDSSRAKPDTQRTQEVWSRLLGNPWQSVISTQAGARMQATEHPGWRSTDGSPLLHAHGLRLQVNRQALPLPLFDSMGSAGPATMGWPDTGLTVATVTLDVANLPSGVSLLEPFDHLNLQMQARTALMHGSGTARTPVVVEQQLNRLTPIDSVSASGMNAVMSVAMPLVELDSVRPPRLQHLPLWRDLVPADRLHEAAP